jgi:hypothetical protein
MAQELAGLRQQFHRIEFDDSKLGEWYYQPSL